MGRSRKKYLPYIITGSHLAVIESLYDATEEWNMSSRLTGSPSPEIRDAIIGFLRNELNRSTYHNFTFNFGQRDIITIQPNPKFCEGNQRAFLHLYGNCLQMSTGRPISFHEAEREQIIDYAEPNLFDAIERFINSLTT